MEMFYPLATSSWDHLEVEAIQKVIKTGMYTMGSHVAQYEKEFAKSLDGGTELEKTNNFYKLSEIFINHEDYFFRRIFVGK